MEESNVVLAENARPRVEGSNVLEVRGRASTAKVTYT